MHRKTVHIPLEAARWPIQREWVQLDDVCDGVFDCPHSTPSITSTGPFVVRSQDVRSGVFRTDEAARVSEETYQERIARAEPAYGDILYSREGTYFGNAAEVPENTKVCLGQRMVLIRPRRGVLNSRFLRLWLNSPVLSRHIHGFRDGTVAERLNMPTIRALPVPIVDIKEQETIASILGAFDDKIEVNRRMNETLEAMASSIFKDWFVDFGPTRAKSEGRDPYFAPEIWALFPDRLDEEGKPQGCKTRSVYEITDVIYGAPFASSEFNNDKVGEPLIRIRDLANETPGAWTSEVHPKGYKVVPGDIVVGMDGEFRAYIWGGAEAWLNQRVCVFAPKNGVSAAFVRNSIIEPLAHVEATEVATTVIHLGKNDIDRFLVVLPTHHVLATFNALAQPMYDRIVANKVEMRTIVATRNLLLPRLLSGEIRVCQAEKLARKVL